MSRVFIMATVYIVWLEFECELCTGRERNATGNDSYKGIHINLLNVSLHNIYYRYVKKERNKSQIEKNTYVIETEVKI